MFDNHEIEKGGFDFEGFTAHIANFVKGLLKLFDDLKALLEKVQG